jgi:hypothetical protein
MRTLKPRRRNCAAALLKLREVAASLIDRIRGRESERQPPRHTTVVEDNGFIGPADAAQ